MVFSPFSAVLGLLVLVPIATFASLELGGENAAVAGFVISLAVSIVGSFKKRK